MSMQNDLHFLEDDTLQEAYEIEVQSKNGKSIRFGELVAGKGESVTTIVIFIRHFFCSYDQSYVRTLAAQLTRELLDTVPPHRKPAQVIIIGCGDHSLIGPYMDETSDAFPLYSDPSGKIYEKLGMKRTYEGFTEPPSYSLDSFWSALFWDIKQRWKAGWFGIVRNGSIDQQGGELIFQRGKLRYAHRMQRMNDHLTADRLFSVLKRDKMTDEASSSGQF